MDNPDCAWLLYAWPSGRPESTQRAVGRSSHILLPGAGLCLGLRPSSCPPGVLAQAAALALRGLTIGGDRRPGQVAMMGIVGMCGSGAERVVRPCTGIATISLAG